jgi:hypothetical protein
MDLVLCFLRCCSVDLLLLMLTQHLEQELSSLLLLPSLFLFSFIFYNVTLLWVDKLFLSVTDLKKRNETKKISSCKTLFFSLWTISSPYPYIIITNFSSFQ